MTTFWILYIFSLFAKEIPVVQSVYTYGKENDLRTYLFTTRGYQIQARPAARVIVNITLSVLTFNSLDVRNQALTTTGYFGLVWEDVRLSWSSHPLYKNDIKVIYSDEHTIWRPSLILANSIADISVMSDPSIPMRIYNDGSVTWTPSGIYKTLCKTDVTFYPFDTQVCDVTISTWGYTSYEISLNLARNPLDFTQFTENGEWELISYSTSSATKMRGANSFSSLTLHLSLKRRPVYHVLNTLTPTFLLAFLSCMAFKLPPDSGERIGYCLTVLLSYAVYLTLVSTNIPTTSVNTSLLSVYLVFILALGMVSVLLTILVLDCHFTDPEKEIPKWITNTTNFLSIITCQGMKTNHGCSCSPGRRTNTVENLETPNQHPNDETSKKSHMTTAFSSKDNHDESDTLYTWIEIAERLDKSFLRLFLFTVLVSTAVFSLVLAIGYAIN